MKYSQLLVRTAQSNSWAARRRELGDLTSMDTNAGRKRPPNPKEPDAFNKEGEEERWTNPRRMTDVWGRKTTGAREVLQGREGRTGERPPLRPAGRGRRPGPQARADAARGAQEQPLAHPGPPAEARWRGQQRRDSPDPTASPRAACQVVPRTLTCSAAETAAADAGTGSSGTESNRK